MPFSSKKILIAAAVFAVVVAVVVYIARRTVAPQAGDGQSQNDPKVTAQALREQEALARTLAETQKTDRDFDGLTNTEEAALKTDPANPDSDADGLLDSDEVKRYKTNPLKADTYGIGHTDGWGVRRGVILPEGKVNR